jgi:ribosomal protein S6--L-glutamate ligase
MHIGVLTARGSGYHPNRRFKESASMLGHRLSLIHPKACGSRAVKGEANLTLRPDPGAIDVLIPRIGATINPYALTLVRQFQLASIPVVNRFEAILLARNKFLTLQTLSSQGLPVPETHYVSNAPNLLRAVRTLGGYPVVAKRASGRQGSGVVLVTSAAAAAFVAENLPIREEGLLVQRYIAPEGRRDLRAFVLGGKVIGALELAPHAGDFRSNIHLTGRGRAVRLEREIGDLAEACASALELEIAGVDIIVDPEGRPWVIEVNYAPGFKGLEACTELDVSSEVIRYVVRTYGGRH